MLRKYSRVNRILISKKLALFSIKQQRETKGKRTQIWIKTSCIIWESKIWTIEDEKDDKKWLEKDKKKDKKRQGRRR